MATLIPALGACVSRMTSGERRLAERLESKLDDDYLLWYDVPMGPKNAHPDFCVMHPRRGILILEVKDWRLSTIQQADKQTWTIAPDGIPKAVINPLEQARQYAHQVVTALERDPQLVQADGPHKGKLAFPWSYGVVLVNIKGHDHESQQGPGVSGGCVARRGAYACGGRGREGSGTGVLCSGYAGYAAAGNHSQCRWPHLQILINSTTAFYPGTYTL